MGGLPRRRPRNECRDVGGVCLVRLRESAGDVGALTLHGGGVNQDEKCHHQQEQRPVRGDGEAGGNQKAPEVERVSGVCVGSSRRQTLILGDVPRSPSPDEHTPEGDYAAHSESERCWAGENQVADAEYEAEWKSETLGNLGISQSASSLRRLRAMTSR